MSAGRERSMGPPAFDVVIPTIGRPSLHALLSSLGRAAGPRPRCTVVVDDRREGAPFDRVELQRLLGTPLLVVRSHGSGPATARDIGWRHTSSAWVVFLDDDVRPTPRWCSELAEDLADAAPEVGGVQGRVVVPMPSRRRPTDWERHVHGLEDAKWITADMAYRRRALEQVDGFDRAFPRAFREDADIALRAQDAGWSLMVGRRTIEHAVGQAGMWVSVRRQLGNADDARMLVRHGLHWRARAMVPRGRRRRHAAICAATATAALGLCTGRRRLATIGGFAAAAGIAELSWARIRNGPRDRREITAMIATSAAIPFVAVASWLGGLVREFGVRLRGRDTG